MTDISSDTSMTHTRKVRTGPPMREYYVYFAVIFLATLPLSVLTWTLTTLRRMEFPARGPIKSAWSQANIITPRIFSA